MRSDDSKPQDPCYNTALHFFCLERFFSAPGQVLNYELEQAIALPHFFLPYKMAATWAMQVGVAIFVYTVYTVSPITHLRSL